MQSPFVKKLLADVAANKVNDLAKLEAMIAALPAFDTSSAADKLFGQRLYYAIKWTSEITSDLAPYRAGSPSDADSDWAVGYYRSYKAIPRLERPAHPDPDIEDLLQRLGF